MKTLVLYAHPAQQLSRVNAAMSAVATNTSEITFVDLYAEYPRFNLNVEVEQQRLLDHDVIVFQFPLMWYSTPPILKEWQDHVLEYGFAYGEGGDKLKGKLWVTAVTAGSGEAAYGPDGHNKVDLRALLAPLEATANLCQMHFIPPYTLFAALNSDNSKARDAHVDGYRKLLENLRDDTFDTPKALESNLIIESDIAKLMIGGAS